MNNPVDPVASEAGRRLAARRRLITTRCAVCGSPVVGTVRRMYCSGRCQRAGAPSRLKPDADEALAAVPA